MNTWKRFIPIAFAGIFAVISSLGIYHFVKNRNAVSHAAIPQIATVPVVIAKNPISIGAQVNERDLELLQVAPNTAPDNGFQSIRSVAGKTSRVNIAPNEPILRSKLLGEDENFSSLIPQGMRAVTVSVKRSEALAQILQRGGTVDVLSFFTFNGTNILTAETIVEQARVLGVHKGGVEGAVKSGANGHMEVTLIVSPDEAKRIVAAMGQSGIELIVRNDLNIV
jgi:Flp pilus assembly protein CpaB